VRRFAYNEQGHDEPVVVTEDDIRRIYYDYWCLEMTRAGKADQISWDNCVDDFLVVNWAWELPQT
jgi:hypothetical protein